MKELIETRVHHYYWDQDLNCAETMLKILAELFSLEINSQVFHSSIGMHGAGKYGAQCGLVEGSLMFIGLLGAARGLEKEQAVDLCREFAGRFEQRFRSLRCKELRPQGFREADPPHLCEGKSRIAIGFTAEFIQQEIISKELGCGQSTIFKQ